MHLGPLDFFKSTEEEKGKIIAAASTNEKGLDSKKQGYFTSLFTGQRDNLEDEESQVKLKELYDVMSERVFGHSEKDTYVYP